MHFDLLVFRAAVGGAVDRIKIKGAYMIAYILFTGFLISIASILLLRLRALTLNRENSRIPVRIRIYDEEA